MTQIVWNPGPNEKVMELTDAPPFVLMHYCDFMIRRGDLGDPAIRRQLREFADALRAHAAGEPRNLDITTRGEQEMVAAHVEKLLLKAERDDAQ